METRIVPPASWSILFLVPRTSLGLDNLFVISYSRHKLHTCPSRLVSSIPRNTTGHPTSIKRSLKWQLWDSGEGQTQAPAQPFPTHSLPSLGCPEEGEGLWAPASERWRTGPGAVHRKPPQILAPEPSPALLACTSPPPGCPHWPPALPTMHGLGCGGSSMALKPSLAWKNSGRRRTSVARSLPSWPQE